MADELDLKSLQARLVRRGTFSAGHVAAAIAAYRKFLELKAAV